MFVHFSYCFLDFAWPSKLHVRIFFSRCKVLWGKGPRRVFMTNDKNYFLNDKFANAYGASKNQIEKSK
jgi:hypothetical protein